MSKNPSENHFPAETARTLAFLQDPAMSKLLQDQSQMERAFTLLQDVDEDETVARLFGGGSKWWRKKSPLMNARSYHDDLIQTHLQEIASKAEYSVDDARSRLPMLVGHDLAGSNAGQAKMYAVLPWSALLSYAMTPFSQRVQHLLKTDPCSPENIPSPSEGIEVSPRCTPSICYHNVRAEDRPIHALVLDFDLPNLSKTDYFSSFIKEGTTAKDRARRLTAAWAATRSESGPVARAARAIEAAWPAWFPGCTAHILLFETRRDVDGTFSAVDFDIGKPSVHGYLFQCMMRDDRSVKSVWPFQGPTFEDKTVYKSFFEDYLHPLLQADPWYEERGICVNSFLDPVTGPTIRAVGMAKWENNQQSSEFLRYSHNLTPMTISDPFAENVFMRHKAYATGRILGIFIDVPISTIYRDHTNAIVAIRSAKEFYQRVVDTRRTSLATSHQTHTASRSSRSLMNFPSSCMNAVVALLQRIVVSTLQSLGTPATITDALELDGRRILVYKNSDGMINPTRVTILAYQTTKCAFCPVRDLTAVNCSHAKVTSRHDCTYFPRSFQKQTTNGTTIFGHTGSGCKMYFWFRVDVDEESSFENVLRHVCWKCTGRGISDKKCGSLLGVIPKQAVIQLRHMLKLREL
ncbi:hypothetical protein CYMTET_55163 [Cymbomonas tetramitiformis]|uniref:Uncharacterized protein n=1 Tax=Cymbomonas tetramitiformis TaxID=36881 RepID=A0AAE0BFC9_9CHLO|nr:hypothetical protein CYMTET_55163 [Cymbomonas tetramitiformis]